MIYENIGAKFIPQTGAQPSLTEEYFYEGYLQGNEYDGYYNITPDAWTWGQWCYVWVKYQFVQLLHLMSLFLYFTFNANLPN